MTRRSPRIPSGRFWASLCAAAVACGCHGGATTDKPKTASAPAQQLAQGQDYRKVYPAFATQSAIAAHKADDSGNAQLDYLVKGQTAPVVLSTQAEPLGVQIAPTDPASALFLDQPTPDGIGILRFVDLTAQAVAPTQLNGADGQPLGGTPVEGFWYGATGHQFLFVSKYDVTKQVGDLNWSDGKSVVQVASGVTPAAVIFSADRTLAVVAIGISDASVITATGSLVAVDLKTGDKTTLVSGALVFGQKPDVAFALSADGKSLAFTTADGHIQRIATQGGEPTPVADAGSSPAISPDGQTVAYFANGKLFSWTSGTPLLLTQAADSVRPQFSPDKTWVVYFQNMVFAGSGAGAVGDAFLVPAAGNGDPVKIGAFVGWDTVAFDPKEPRLSAVTDLTTLDGHGSYDAIGNLVTAQPGHASEKLAGGTRPGSVFRLDASGELAYLAGMKPGVPLGNVYVTVSNAAPLKLKEDVLPGSLRTAKGFDSLVFISDVETEPIDNGVYRVGTLYGSTPKGPAKVMANGESGVIDVVFGRDGRPVAIVAKGDKAGIWTLPAP